MTTNINVPRVRTLLREIVAEANWVIGELSTLQKEGADQGRAPAIEPLYEKVLITAMYDGRTEVDVLEDRLNDPAVGDPAAPAKLLVSWLVDDTMPLVQLGWPTTGADDSLLGILLMTGSGEIAARVDAIRAELAPLLGATPKK